MAGTDTPDPIETIRERWAAGSPGPWRWAGYPDDMRLASGGWTVMDFARKGMRGAQPRFNTDGLMVNGSEMVRFEVDYRKDIVGVSHPDAEKIAAAPKDIAALLAEVKRLRLALDIERGLLQVAIPTVAS